MDNSFEFSAPKFYNFINGETKSEIHNAELWFKSAINYPPSPFTPVVKVGRTVNVESFSGSAEVHDQKDLLSSEVSITDCLGPPLKANFRSELWSTESEEMPKSEAQKERSTSLTNVDFCDHKGRSVCIPESGSDKKSTFLMYEMEVKYHNCVNTNAKIDAKICTPKLSACCKGYKVRGTNTNEMAKKTGHIIGSASAQKSQGLLASKAKLSISSSVKRKTDLEILTGISHTIKRQKLENGNSGQVNVTESTEPFVSMAEMVLKFQTSTRDLLLPPASKSFPHSNQRELLLTKPKSPMLHTSRRPRPGVKSTLEREMEELEKTKFKARPVDKKIFECKGGLGVFCSLKKEVTKTREFQFATDQRIPPPATVFDVFGKLSISSEQWQGNSNSIQRITTPNPFHLITEERGTQKRRKLMNEVMQRQWEEEQARIPKANPYPYTTDYPVIPPKPEPKHCTIPVPFELESLVRHEEERPQRNDGEEAQTRYFKAQPVLREDPIPLPQEARMPLTEVQEFNHYVDHRAVERAKFDQKVKEKEEMYERYREECEAAKMMEQEKELKRMRRTMAPHARPLPNFRHPFLPQKSTKEITKPMSPKWHVKQREHQTAGAVSCAATRMR